MDGISGGDKSGDVACAALQGGENVNIRYEDKA